MLATEFLYWAKTATPGTANIDQIGTPVRPEHPRPQNSLPSLQQRLKDHEGTIQEHEKTTIRMKEDEKLLQSQVWAFSDQLNKSKAETDALHGKIGTLEEEMQSLRGHAQASEMRINALNGSCYENVQELTMRSNTIRVLSDHNQRLQNRVADLENIVAVASRDSGTDLRSFVDGYSDLKMAHDEMTARFKSEEELRSNLHDTLQERESENACLRTVIDELQKDVLSLEVCQPQTVRSLLTLRLVEQASTLPPVDGSHDTADEVQNWLPTGLPENSLDKICSPSELAIFANFLPKGRAFHQFYKRLRLDVCSVCSKAKFNFRLDGPSNQNSVKWLNEYLPQTRYFSCCYERVCKMCFTKHLLDTLESKWWYKLGTLQWFSCPRDGCDESLGIRCEADLQLCLERNCDTEAEDHLKKYIKTLVFRQALETLDPKPSYDVLKKAMQLHQHLVTANRMYSLFDPRFDPMLVDEAGCIPEFQPGSIFSCVMDDGISPIPLFLKFLRRQSRPKTCMVCSKSMFEIDYVDLEAWKTACGKFNGSWMWNVLVFPTREIQYCDHDFEWGPSAGENLSCPQCAKKLSYQEVQQLADPKTVAKYDKFLLQTCLSNEPDFRWCLAPLCENGQLYQSNPHTPKILCEECAFEMCFTHEMSWHDGLTCDEYESQRDHGDPSFAETREWIRTNTKPCPGCQVGIQKGEACFHMTCSQCSHQFCWQCLANWEDIRRQGQEGHSEGCFFRTNDVRPTGIQGESLEDALRARTDT